MGEERNVAPTSLRLVCPCGYVANGDIEVELISNIRNHIDEAHPKNAGVSDEELLASAQRVPAR